MMWIVVFSRYVRCDIVSSRLQYHGLDTMCAADYAVYQLQVSIGPFYLMPFHVANINQMVLMADVPYL